MRKIVLLSALVVSFVLVAASPAKLQAKRVPGDANVPVYPASIDPNSLLQKYQAQIASEWIRAAMKTMQTIRPGMTRSDLEKVFTGDGGLSTRLQRTYHYRDSLYIHVDVTFKAVGPADKLHEEPLDKIVTISRPYLGWAIMD